MNRPTSPVAVVTGAAGGIGAAVASTLTRDGFCVVGVDRDPVPPQVGCAASFTVDVGDATAVEQLAARVEHDLGAASALVNVAGVLRPGAIARISPEDASIMLQVNVIGVLNCLRAFAPQLRERAPSAVVTVASNSAGVPRTGIGVYGATKAAASALTRSFGLEEAGRGVRCNVVNPGSTATPMLDALWADDPEAAQRTVDGEPDAFRLGIPAGRIADPPDVADVVSFLLGPGARHVHLQELYVDGGATLHP